MRGTHNRGSRYLYLAAQPRWYHRTRLIATHHCVHCNATSYTVAAPIEKKAKTGMVVDKTNTPALATSNHTLFESAAQLLGEAKTRPLLGQDRWTMAALNVCHLLRNSCGIEIGRRAILIRWSVRRGHLGARLAAKRSHIVSACFAWQRNPGVVINAAAKVVLQSMEREIEIELMCAWQKLNWTYIEDKSLPRLPWRTSKTSTPHPPRAPP